MNIVSKTLIAGALTAAMVLPASGAFAGEKTNKAILGAVIGGVAGAALGQGDRGAIAVGAVAGAAIGASTARNDHDRYGRDYRDGYGYQTRQTYSGYSGYNGYNAYNTGYQTRDAYRRDRSDRYDHNRYDSRYDGRYDQGYRR